MYHRRLPDHPGGLTTVPLSPASATMNHPSPPRLMIPSSSASPSSITNMSTGRPPLWTNSTQRKVCRLYLYTTLSISKILEVVHHPMPVDSIPGKDSANKKLNALLDKEPRWLKPRNEEDMIRRCEQLAKSLARATAGPWPAPFARPHSNSAPPMSSQTCTTPIKQEAGAQSATLGVSPWSNSPASQFPSTPYNGPSTPQPLGAYPATHGHGRALSDDYTAGDVTLRLMRVNSGLSTSTDQTTGSFHRMLEGVSDNYIRSVKRLIKRYTAPIGQSPMGMSPLSDTVAAEPTWVNDPDASAVFNTRPFPLPGDLLSIDLHLQLQNYCFAESEEHQKRWCLCHAQCQTPDFAWATAQGPTRYGMQLLTTGAYPAHAELQDDFGNTMLHFLAARGLEELLIHAVQAHYSVSILNVRNSAGQTFLHVLCASWFQRLDALFHLLDLLATRVFDQGTRFDIGACDHYGRTFFHMLPSSDIPSETLQSIFQRYRGIIRTSRDAFDFQPMPPDARAPTEAMDCDPPESHDAGNDPFGYRLLDSRFLQLAREASSNPSLEDDAGRNGLHCLAMATLSQRSLMNKVSPSPTTPQGRNKKRAKTPEEMLDSSEEKLQFRLSLVEGLLDAGIDPNHYDSHGNTPLMAFCAELPEDDDYKTGPLILERLLEHGANIHARNRGGETALHLAVRCGRKLAVKVLLDHGANVHARDASGRGLLALADAKMRSCRKDVPVDYCHYEACRAYLSGKGFALQEPSVLQEWGART